MDEKHDTAGYTKVSSSSAGELMVGQNGAGTMTGYSDGLAGGRAIGGNGGNLVSSKERPETPHSVLNLDPYVNIGKHTHTRGTTQPWLIQKLFYTFFTTFSHTANSRRTTLLAREPPIGGSDRDDNKYKRRTPKEIFSRWSRRLYAPSARPVWRKTWFLVGTGLLGFVCIVYVMATISRGDDQGDRELGGFVPNRNLPHAEE